MNKQSKVDEVIRAKLGSPGVSAKGSTKITLTKESLESIIKYALEMSDAQKNPQPEFPSFDELFSSTEPSQYNRWSEYRETYRRMKR